MQNGRVSTHDCNRVVVLSQVPPPVHGSTVMTERLIRVLETAGISVRLVSRRFSASIGEVGQGSLRKVFRVPALIRELRAALQTGPDAIVFFLTNRPGSFLVDVLLMRAMRSSGVPVVAYLHTVGFQALAARGALWRRLVVNTLTTPVRVVTLGPSLDADVADWVPVQRLRSIGNATEDEAVVAHHGVQPRLLFLSNLQAEKGVAVFIALLKRLRVSFPGIAADIAGGATAEQASQLCADVNASGLSAVVTWHGQVDEGTRRTLMQQADLLVFPSQYRFEAQPLTIIEAASFGVPTVAFDVGGIADLDWVMCVPQGDEAALTERVTQLLADPIALTQASLQARQSWHQQHTIEQYSRAWVQLLNETVAAESSASLRP